MSGITKSGYLQKKGGAVFNPFKKRWFELRNGVLSYFAEPNTECLGMIVLANTKVEGKKLQIEISGSHLPRTFELQAADEKDRDDWINAMRAASAPLPPPPEEQLVFQRDRSDGGFDIPAGTKIGLDSFQLITVIGRGSFGKVMRVALKCDPQKRPLAMKVMRKDLIVREDMVANTKREKQILASMTHPFIVKIHFAFQTRECLFLVLDLLSGGELFYHLKEQGHFNVNRARMYCAEIVSALTHLHSLDIVYRDLKPENIVLDRNGHACLTDFGLAKTNISKNPAYTFCGTPEYLAPEVLQGKGHGRGVDWWSLGCVLYEMLAGLPPFFSEDVNQMYDFILRKDLTFPDCIPPEARDLISQWLERDPAKRLDDGNRAKQHPFFKGIDWGALDRGEYTPEWVPNPDSEKKDLYVGEEFTSEFAGMSVMQAASFAEANFEGFTYDPKRAPPPQR